MARDRKESASKREGGNDRGREGGREGAMYSPFSVWS